MDIREYYERRDKKIAELKISGTNIAKDIDYQQRKLNEILDEIRDLQLDVNKINCLEGRMGL